MKFKVGDKVRCKKAAGRLISNAIYTVSRVDYPYLGLDRDEDSSWLQSRFELVQEAEAKLPIPSVSKTTLPTDSNERKNYPMFRGLLKYFPAALAGVSKISKAGNDKHNPGEELHHARSKSQDHGDCIIRHLLDTADLLAAVEHGEKVTQQEVLNEANQLAWRALAFSQLLHEQFGAPLAPGAKK